jgi:hypothetical protein
MYVCMYICLCMCVCVYVCMYVCTYMYVCMYIYVCMYVLYIYIYIYSTFNHWCPLSRRLNCIPQRYPKQHTNLKPPDTNTPLNLNARCRIEGYCAVGPRTKDSASLRSASCSHLTNGGADDREWVIAMHIDELDPVRINVPCLRFASSVRQPAQIISGLPRHITVHLADNDVSHKRVCSMNWSTSARHYTATQSL